MEVPRKRSGINTPSNTFANPPADSSCGQLVLLSLFHKHPTAPHETAAASEASKSHGSIPRLEPGATAGGPAPGCSRQDPVVAISVGLVKSLERQLDNASQLEMLEAVRAIPAGEGAESSPTPLEARGAAAPLRPVPVPVLRRVSRLASGFSAV